MQILTSRNIVSFYGTIEKGIYDADPSRELYKIENEDGTFYAVVEGFELFEVDAMPEDYKPGLYCYTEEDGFYKNPDYKEPIRVEDEVRKLMAENAELRAKVSEMETVQTIMLTGTTPETPQ